VIHFPPHQHEVLRLDGLLEIHLEGLNLMSVENMERLPHSAQPCTSFPVEWCLWSLRWGSRTWNACTGGTFTGSFRVRGGSGEGRGTTSSTRPWSLG